MIDDNPHAERLLALRRSVSQEYGLSDDDWRVKRLGLLLAQHAAIEDRCAAGNPIDVGDLLALDEAIESIRSALKVAEPLDICVRVAERVVGLCPLCKGTVEDYTPPPPKPVPTPVAKPEAPPVVAKAPAPAPAAHTRRVVPLTASAVSPLSFSSGHDPARHNDSPLSWGPHPYLRKDTSR